MYAPPSLSSLMLLECVTSLPCQFIFVPECQPFQRPGGMDFSTGVELSAVCRRMKEHTKPSKMTFIITNLSGRAEAWTFIHVLIYQIKQQLAFLEAPSDLEAAFAVASNIDACLMKRQNQI